MKKSKIAGDILAVMEVSHQSTMGGRTRTRDAKTLALQRLQLKTNPSRSPAPNLVASSTPEEEEDVSSFSYLQLRSRRLEKLPPPVSNQSKLKQQGKESSSCREEKKMKKKKNGDNRSKGCFGKTREMVVELEMGICCETDDASFGENNLDFQLRDR